VSRLRRILARTGRVGQTIAVVVEESPFMTRRMID